MKKRTKKSPVIHEGEVLQAMPTPRINLSTIEDIRREMGRVYREMRSRKIEGQEGTRLVYVLAQIGKLAELYEIEKRIIALEAIPKGKK
ncbi:MAG: hypothetical protein ACQ9ET_00820 [Nitrosomonadaceae bacterium]